MKKRSKVFTSVLFSFAALLCLANCEIGLGPQVDSDTPTISVTSPDIGLSLKGTVTIAGICHDDNAVDRVEVSIRNSDGHKIEVGTITKENIVDGTSWSIEADTTLTDASGKKQYPDGTYEIVADVYDVAKRHSSATRSFNIDNTAPLVLMSRPNSMSVSDVDQGVFGATVTLAGEILDDHDIDALYIQAYDENGTKIELRDEQVIDPDDPDDTSTWQKFTGFDVQGGVNLIIAQFGNPNESGISDKDMRLASNYLRLYGYSDIDYATARNNTSRVKTVQLVVVATDISGNRSLCSYIKSSLNELITSETGIPAESLRSTKYKTIANGSCPVDSTFTQARQNKIRDILNNISSYTDVDYASSADGNKLTLSLCADNSPKYDVSGYALGNGDWPQVTSAGTVSFTVTSGLDQHQIQPQTLEFSLYACNDSGTYNSNAVPFFTTKANVTDTAGTPLEKKNEAIYWTENSDKTYTKNSSVTVDEKAYSVQLPVMMGGTRYAIKIEGIDEAGNDIMPTDGSNYVFQVAATGGAPHVTGTEQVFYKKQAYLSGGNAQLELRISDTSGQFRSDGLGKITVTPTVYPGYWLKTNYTSSATSSVKSAITATVANGRIASVSGSDSNFTATIPLAGLLTNGDTRNNYTILLEVVAQNGADNEGDKKETSRYLLWADCSGPVIQLSNIGWVDTNGNSVAHVTNDETSAYLNRMTYAEAKQEDGVTDIIARNGLSVDDDTIINLYSLRGYWSDIEGSGTKAMYFQVADSVSELTSAALDTTLSADNEPTNSRWIRVNTTNTTPGAKTKAGVTNAQMIREGSGSAIAIFAVDNVGNKSAVYRWDDLTFDFGEPELTVPSPREYYSAVPVELEISAEDSNRMNGITVTATRNGNPVSSGNNGYVLATGTPVSRATATNPLENAAQLFDADRVSTQTASITLNGTSGAADGNWEFTVVATDCTGRTSAAKTFATTVDTVAPVVSGDLTISNRAYDEDTSWYKNETLRVAGQYAEATSGLEKVYYVVKSSDATTAAQNTINAAVTAGDITALTIAGSGMVLLNTEGSASPTSYTVSPSGFKLGNNTLYIQAVDRAGNKSAVSSYTVRIDQKSPSLAALFFTYDGERFETASGTIYSNKDNDLVVYGTVSDENSGVAEFTSFYTGSGNSRTEIPATFTYSTGEVTTAQSVSGITFTNYSAITDKTTIKSWKAVVDKDDLIDGTYKLTAYDVALNSQPQTFFTMVIDEEDPVPTMVSPENSTTLNDIVDFRGTTTDNTSVRKLSLYYSYTSSAATITSADTLVKLPGANNTEIDAVLTDADTYNWEFKGLPVTYTESNSVKLLGNQAYANAEKTVYFKLLAEDIAGNTKVVVRTVSLDPDADRPHITLSNVVSDGTTLLKSSEVYGNVVDDDGLIKGLWVKESASAPTTWPTLTNNNGWTKIDVSNGNFTANASTGDGEKSWFLYCIDGAGGAFTTAHTDANAQLTRPYISFKDTANVDVKEAIVFTVDQIPPELKNIRLSKAATGTTTAVATYEPEADSAADWATSGNIPFGGDFNVMYVRFDVEEAAGMATSDAVELKIGGVVQTLTSSNLKVAHTDGTSLYTYTAGPFVLGNTFTNAAQALSIKVIDAAGTSAQLSKNIVVDNVAPTVTIGSPTSNDHITTTTEIIGSADDNAGGSGVNVIKWMIPTKAEVTAGVTADTKRNGVSAWTTLSSTATISIPFDSPDDEEENCILHYANATYTSERTGSTGLWDVPVYFLVKDALGNTRIDTTYAVTADTESGKATAYLSYPVNGQTIDGQVQRVGVGGQLDISGLADAANGVREVLVQFDVNGDGAYTEADYTLLSGWGTDFSEKTLRGSTAVNANNWGFVADGTSTWQITVITSRISYQVSKTINGVTYTGDAGTTVTDASGNVVTETVQGKVVPATYPNPEMGIRAAAYDTLGDTRGWTAESLVTIDKTVPVISGTKVIGYRGNTAEIEYEYVDNMYIAGKTGITWYFEAQLSDDVKVDSVTFDTVGNNIGIEYTTADHFSYPTASDVSHARIKVPLVTSTDGLIYSRMKAIDDTGKESPLDIRINIDSTAPSLYDTSDSTTAETSELRLKSKEQNVNEDTNYVQNSNKVYTFGDTIEEAGSGLAYVAFYFERTSTANGNRVYNPLYADNNRANVSDTTYPLTSDDGLLSWHVTNATRPDTGSITVTGIGSNNNIRVGGLVKIGGAYRKITAKTGDTVSISPAVSTSFKDVRFVYAQVVDHLRVTEGPTNGNYDTPTNDDNDGLVEKLVVKGSTYTWSASIYSERIPDGPVNIHVVAIDAAGNLSHGVCASNVYNNRPRIAKVLLATELNGNGTYDFNAEHAITQTGDAPTASGVEFGEFVYYSTLTSGQASSEYAVENELDDTYILKNGMLLLPEFVGGNGAIKATYKITDSAATAVRTAKTAVGTVPAGTEVTLKTAAQLATLTADVTGTAQPISAHISSKGGFLLENTTLTTYESRRYVAATETTEAYVDTKQKWLGITFWDSTEEKTQGKDSQWAFIKFPVIVDTVDDIVPEAEIDPFYWKSAQDNSVYRNASGLMGHIELEEDFVKTFASHPEMYGDTTRAQGREYDGDPKVSGIIRIVGSASDETKLTKLTLAVSAMQLNSQTAGAETELATFTDGAWEFANDAVSAVGTYSAQTGTWDAATKAKLAQVETEGWSLAIMDSGVTQNGHSIVWELDIDTQKMTSAAGIDRSVTVKAYDSRNNTAASYVMDVVPYITGVTTSLSAANKSNPSVFSRTASGRYPVYITYETTLTTQTKYEAFTISGFNTSGADLYLIPDDTAKTAVKLTYNTNNKNYPLTQDCYSGSLELRNGTILSLNNRNYDDSCGDYDYTDYGYAASDLGVTGNKTIYAHYYNRQPNGANNNLLTDDVKLDVWQINKKAAVPENSNALDVMMKINPVSGKIGFAFCNGRLKWCMPNGDGSANKNDTSYTSFADSKDFMQCSAFTYDPNGNTYGVAAGGESNTNQADAYSVYASKWGTCGKYSFSNRNQFRIGSTAQDDFNNMAKDRYRSSSLVADGTNLYLAYYDLLEGQIRFKVGPNVPAKKTDASQMTVMQYNKDSQSNQNLRYFGNFLDFHTDTSYKNDDTPYVQIIANDEGEGLGYGGEYLSLGRTSKAIVLVWYDAKNGNLMFSYTTGLTEVLHGQLTKVTANDGKVTYQAKNESNGTVTSGWTEPQVLLEGAGKYCQLAVGSDNSIHVAAFDSSKGNLMYVYIPSKTGASAGIPDAENAISCKVDTYQSVGKEITIDVAQVGTRQIPYIGYWGTTPKKARLAYLADPESFFDERSPVRDGADGDKYTGVWECAIVPTTSTANSGDTVHRINVGVWKTTAGALTKSTTGTAFIAEDKNSGKCYGNGTSNAVLGYSIEAGSGGNIETAQRR